MASYSLPVKERQSSIWRGSRAAYLTMTLCTVLGMCGSTIYAQTHNVLEVYPGPGVDTHRSKLYKVEVKADDDSWQDSYTYQVSHLGHMSFATVAGKNPSVNFTTFGTTAVVKVRVSKIKGVIASVDVSPKSKSIPATLANGSVELQLKPYDKAWVVIDHDEMNPLFIYADPPKPSIPKKAVYFGPGVHDIGLAYQVKDGQTVYLDGGAWVTGTLDLRKRSNVTITGPGVLSGENYPGELVAKIKDKSVYHMIIGDGSGDAEGNNHLERITIVDSPSYNMTNTFDYIGGVKLLSPWVWSTDGFHLVGHGNKVSLLEHCFAFIGDDVIFPRENYKGNVEYRDSFFSTTNNSVFQISYWGTTLDHKYTAYIHDIDIKNFLIRDSDAKQAAIFRASINSTPDQGVKNMTFENIRIEGDLKSPLIQIENRHYFWPEQTTKAETSQGNTYNMVFRNISVSGRMLGPKSTLLGLDDKNGLHDYLFENVSVGGVVLTTANFGKYFTVNKFVSNLRVVAAPTIAHGQ